MSGKTHAHQGRGPLRWTQLVFDGIEGDAAQPSPVADVHLTDVGNGRLFASQHAGKILFVPTWGFRVYDPNTGVWRADDGAVMRCAKQTALSWYALAAETSSDDERRRIVGHATATESARALAAMIKMAESEPALQAQPKDFDTDPLLLNATNGVIDLRT